MPTEGKSACLKAFVAAVVLIETFGVWAAYNLYLKAADYLRSGSATVMGPVAK